MSSIVPNLLIVNEAIYALDVLRNRYKRVYPLHTTTESDTILRWLLRGPLSPMSGLIQQLIVLEYQDGAFRYVYRTQESCVELTELTPEHTLFIMQCV